MSDEVALTESQAAEKLQTYPGLVFSGSRRTLGGRQALFCFDNGYGASLILGPGSYGLELGTVKFQAGAPKPQGSDDYFDHAELQKIFPEQDDSVYGYLSPEDVFSLLDRIRALPRVSNELTSPEELS